MGSFVFSVNVSGIGGIKAKVSLLVRLPPTIRYRPFI